MGLSCFKSWKHDRTGHKGNRDVLASPGSYFFLSNSAGQGDEWLKSLNKGVWIPFTGVFGQRLEETVLYERRYGMRLVPLVVEQCVTFIRERGLHEVGLFRQSGQASLVKELQEAFDAGERPSFDSSTDVHTVASLLKLYLRQLPEPLVPYSHYQEFLLCGQKLTSNRTLGLGELRNLLHELPVANFNLLNFICQFLNEVQSYSSSNKMSSQNLATVFGPNILRAKAEDPQSIMGGAALVQVLMLELIREHESLFAKFPPPASARPPGAARASPSPLRQPHLHPPPCLRQLSLPLITERSAEPGPASRDEADSSCVPSSAARSDVSSGQKRILGHRYTSSHPENCFYPLPSCSQSNQHHSGQANISYHQRHSSQERPPGSIQASTSSLQLHEQLSNRPKTRPMFVDWAEGWPGGGEATADVTDVGFWISGAAEDQGAVPETASRGSSEAQEDSTLSAYDNLDRVSRCERLDITSAIPESGDLTRTCGEKVDREVEVDLELEGEGEGEGEGEEVEQTRGSSSSWSSCEVLPLDEGGEAADAVTPDRSPHKRLPSSQAAGEENRPNVEENISDDDEDDDDDNHHHHPNSPASCSVLSESPLSTGSSDVFLPSGSAELEEPELQLETRDAHSLLSELQLQMAQQRAEYQARIQRLERCNDVLKRQVAVLRISLEQQRRSQSVAEIKIRNMERAKADADLRNSTLQREMEMFFQMYGEFRGKGGKGGGGSL